jgi:hypothetical protein
MSTVAQAVRILQNFDVFTRVGGKGWSYSGSVEAKSMADAKYMVMQDNPDLTANNIALYIKRK